MAVTTWNIAPDYDAWGPDSAWTCQDWMQWHKLLKEHFGETKAKYVWEYAYAKQTLGASALDCRTFNSQFRAYVAENNLDPYQNAGVFEPVIKGYGTISDVVGSAFDGISNVFGGKTGKAVATVLLIGAIGLVAYKGIQAYTMLKK